jgi:hypothetical protein
LRQTQNTIGNGLGLDLALRKQLASATKTVDVMAELITLATPVKKPSNAG